MPSNKVIAPRLGMIILCCVLVTMPPVFGQGNADTSGDLAEETTIGEIVLAFPNHAEKALQMVLEPEEFATRWKGTQRPIVVAFMTLFWCALLLTLLSWVARALMLWWLRDAIDQAGAEQPLEEVHEKGPRIVDVGVSIGDCQVALDRGWVESGTVVLDVNMVPKVKLPEENPLNQDTPQYMVLLTGFLYVLFAGVRPSVIHSRAFTIGLTALFCFVAIACVQPIAALIGTDVTFAVSLGYTIVFGSYFMTLGMIVGIVSQILLFTTLRVGDPDSDGPGAIGCLGFAVVWLGTMALSFLAIKAFFVGYQTLYGFGFWTLVGTGFGGLVISILLSPLFSIPMVWLLLKLRKPLDIVV